MRKRKRVARLFFVLVVMVRVWVVVLMVLQLVVPTVAGNLVHFYINVGERRCFYKDLHQEVLLLGKYKMEIKHHQSQQYYTPKDKLNTGVLIDVEETFDSNHRIVHQRGRSSGQFSFTALDSGEHRICLTARSFFKKWNSGGSNDPTIIEELKFKSARILIDFFIGDGTLLDSKRTGEVSTLNDKVKKLNDKLMDIKREQLFIREREEGFRDLSELTNERVVRWSIIQLGALLMTGIYQLFTLHRFFVKVKME